MKELDRFSRFENSVYQLFAILLIFGFPLGAIYVADALFLDQMNPFLRYPLWALCGLVGIVIGIAVGSMVEDSFSWVRKVFGMKPLSDLQQGIADEDAEMELDYEERRHDSFVSSSEKEQRYRLWMMQLRQIECLNAVNKNLDLIKYILVLVVVLYVAAKYIK